MVQYNNMPERSDIMRCRRCGGNLHALDANCRRCGIPVRVTDPRVCAYCGKLKDMLLEKCEDCEDAYVPPIERAPLQPTRPPQERPTAVCPRCGAGRMLNDIRCPRCNTNLPPRFSNAQ